MTASAWDAASRLAQFAGGEPYFLPLTRERRYLPDLAATPADIAERARILWLCYPGAPTGVNAPKEFFEDAIAARRSVGYLPESNPLYEEMLVAEYLEHVAELRGLSAQDARSGISDAADETDLSAVFYRPIGECSKGYRQRIGLAGAILHRPEVLILDEPTEGLDPNQRVEIRRLVSSLGRERTVLLNPY